jgi:hypothetical protein
MPEPRGNGTLVIAALLSLGLVFAASWILFYVEPGGDPRSLVPWFGAAVAVVVTLAFLGYVRRGRGKGGQSS